MNAKLLILNMGSTSTKVAVYNGREMSWKETIDHPREDISKFLHFMDQYSYRKEGILKLLDAHGDSLDSFDVFISRGGTIKPVPGGVWRINQKMLDDSQSGAYGDHPCNIGGQIAFDLAAEFGKEACTVDPPICSEFCDEAYYSGLPEIRRLASFQQLNHRAIARKYAEDAKTPYNELNLIVAHMGGGISVAAHAKGKIIDVNNALAGDGPFALERSGDLPVGDLIKICYSGKYTQDEILRRVNGRGGMYAYTGMTDGRELDKKIAEGDKEIEAVTKAMAYQVAKEIGGLASVFKGDVDAVVLTAGLAYWKYFVELVSDRVKYIAPIHVYPGENEMESLAFGVCRYLDGEEPAQDYA